MQFNSFEYWIFFAIVCCVLVASKPNTRRIAIVISSYVFYSCWDPRFSILLAASTVANYALGICIEDAAEHKRKAFVSLAVVLNLVVLGFFKYFNFFVGSFAEALHLSDQSLSLHIILPVGISFFTFEGIAYCVDIYRKDIRAVRSLTDFSLFISFFPHLVAGPIIRPENFFPQVGKNFRPTIEDISWSACQIIKGLIKKIIFADFFAVVANDYFNDPATSAVAPAIGIIAFAMQIYFDFAGYTDIARGCAALLGFKFPSNFERPYLATNIADFWRRWHISLSSWLRDYLYISLGGNRVGPSRTYLNLMIVMGLGGLWHGASWNFMVWGLAHGAMLCVHRCWGHRIKPHIAVAPAIRPATTLLGGMLTFVCVAIAWIPFRSVDFATTSVVLKQLFSIKVLSIAGSNQHYWLLLAVSALWCIADGNRRIQRWLTESLPYPLIGVPVGLALVSMELFGQFDLHVPFIYFKF
ncbi:MAG: MBOAT family O-acyltransferase [Pseudomonadota bacterium]|jgi:alginate O-acetyltransferase complex protein AlgI|uniref:MBOAT family O-acyltransferase n=1 Tax=Burkholderia sp. 4M9327F10 TaxID=2502223 RepID=UPI0010F69593|nr:MBOAT family O-acyltransferase [Burkholderia sp. 4M9327F10]